MVKEKRTKGMQEQAPYKKFIRKQEEEQQAKEREMEKEEDKGAEEGKGAKKSKGKARVC